MIKGEKDKSSSRSDCKLSKSDRELLGVKEMCAIVHRDVEDNGSSSTAVRGKQRRFVKDVANLYQKVAQAP